ncbi:hypothetical protein BXZ70DRAFT_925716 [Cristinia sonorae]|uniref:Uncharacterized protein n=1 Tax=Cristinia sonorae TaxID=1940300 RepID=A0A8K0UVC6_9AGAR|nr:hypothetical protein BXZ70DRAFT_925716 [Cristinia sonorae]
MIIDKTSLPNDPTPEEAPPSYDTIQSNAGPSSYTPNEKPPPPNPYTLPSSPPSPNPSPLTPKGKASTKTSSSWFGFGQASRVSKEVKATVHGLVRDLVQNADSDMASSLAILESCSQACAAHGIPLSSVLQDKSIEGHSSIYWAIIKRPSSQSARHGSDLLNGILSFASPLTEVTIAEVRTACLDTSNQQLFQQLRKSAAFAPLSGPEQILLGTPVPPDDIEIDEVAGDQGAFVAHLRVVAFQKRMRVAKHVHLEFIARGRIWRLSFVNLDSSRVVGGKHFDKGKWIVILALLEHSPPTWIDSRLVVEDVRSPKQKPTVELRIRSGMDQLKSSSYPSAIGVSLEESLMASSLQYEDSSYINPDGSLYARLEAKLVRSDDTECIIC